MGLKQHLISLEQQLLTPQVRASRASLDALISDDFLEISAAGVSFGKSNVLTRLPKQKTPIFSNQDFELRMLSDTVAQLVYLASIEREGEARVYSRRTSIWRCLIVHDGAASDTEHWQMCFHQGTPCQQFSNGDIAQNNKRLR